MEIIVWLLVIFAFSQQSNTGVYFGEWNILAAKIAHVIEFAVLAICIYQSMIRSWFSRNEKLMLALIFTMNFALADELHQSFIPGRTCSMVDVGIDSIGALLGLLVILATARN